MRGMKEFNLRLVDYRPFQISYSIAGNDSNAFVQKQGEFVRVFMLTSIAIFPSKQSCINCTEIAVNLWPLGNISTNSVFTKIKLQHIEKFP